MQTLILMSTLFVAFQEQSVPKGKEATTRGTAQSKSQAKKDEAKRKSLNELAAEAAKKGASKAANVPPIPEGEAIPPSLPGESRTMLPTKAGASSAKDSSAVGEAGGRNVDTQNTIDEVLTSGWAQSSSTGVMKQSGSARTRGSRKRNVDVADVDWAFGLVLMKHMMWQQALGVYKGMTVGHPKEPLPWIAFAHVQIAQGNWNAAVNTIDSAMKIDPTYEPSYTYLAVVSSFSEQKPPAKFKRTKLTEIRNAYFAKLDAEAQKKFRKAEADTAAYVADLPKRRAKMTAHLATSKKKIEANDEKLKKMESEYLTLQKILISLIDERDQLLQEQALVNSRYIGYTKGVTNSDELNQIGRNRSAALAPYATRLNDVATRIAETDATMTTLARDYGTLKVDATAMAAEVNRQETLIDAQLATPPFILDLIGEKERLMTGGSFRSGIAASKPPGKNEVSASSADPTPKPTDEIGDAAKAAEAEMKEADAASPAKTAESSKNVSRLKTLKSLASSFKGVGNKVREKETLEKIVKEFPESDEAESAKVRLLEIKGDSNDGGKPSK